SGPGRGRHSPPPPAEAAESSIMRGFHRPWRPDDLPNLRSPEQCRTAIELMLPHPQKSTGQTFALRLKIFYAALFITLGVQMPFLPVWLTAKGLDAQAVGIVLAVPIVVRIFAIPLATRAADGHDALRGVIIVAAVGATAGFAALGFAPGTVAIAILYALASACYAPVMMLADTYALRGLPRRGRAYGPVRLWGSAAFIVASFGAGALLTL